MQDLAKWDGPYNQRLYTACQHQLCQFCRQLETRNPNKRTKAKLKIAMYYKGCAPLLRQQRTRFWHVQRWAEMSKLEDEVSQANDLSVCVLHTICA